MPTLKVCDIPVANPAVISRESPDCGLVLVNCDSGSALAINGSGTVVWRLIDGRRSPADIIDTVSRSFENVPDQVCEDVRGFLGILEEEGFIGYEVIPTRAEPGSCHKTAEMDNGTDR